MNNLEKLISENEYLKSKLDESESELELLNAALELSETGFTLSDKEGTVVRVNPAQIRITGHPKEYTIGRSMLDIETENFNKSATMQIVKTLKPVTIEQILPSGKSYLVYGQPYFDKNGDLKYVICNLIDNTQHNYAKQQLIKTLDTKYKLEKEMGELQSSINNNAPLIFSSNSMKSVISICDKISNFNSIVLISGPSGVGKELISNYIVEKSHRAKNPYIKVNCSSIPESLLESELFGYEAGAFTHASTNGKKGIFELANGGTLLLDEIGELPLHLQSKFLRVIQDSEFYRVGGTTPIKVDIRIIAATNRDLEEMAKDGSFREDLYYRLSVINIKIPPLDERKEDIPLLVRYFIRMFNSKYNLNKEISFDALRYLAEQDYPGNVRELKNIIERTILLSVNEVLSVNDFDPNQYVDNIQDEDKLPANMQAPTVDFNNTDVTLKELVSNYEKELLKQYLDKYKKASKIAEVLNTNQPTISRKLHSYGLLK